MGKLFLEYLQASRLYTCRQCQVHLSSAQDLLSKDFSTRQGKAFLYEKAVNYVCGPSMTRYLRTGNHHVRDIYCVGCQTLLGWRYEWAEQPSQKYKEGKVIIERTLIEKAEWVG